MPEAVENCVESVIEEEGASESEAYAICWSRYNDGELKEDEDYEWGPYNDNDRADDDNEGENEDEKDVEDGKSCGGPGCGCKACECDEDDDECDCDNCSCGTPLEEKSPDRIAREVYNKYDVDEDVAKVVAHLVSASNNGGLEDPLAVKSVALKTITGEWQSIHPGEKTKGGRDHLRETYKYLVDKILGQGEVAKTLSKSKNMEKIDFTAEFSGTHTVFKAEDDFIIWGPASVEVVDKEGDRIHAEALEDALPQLLKRGRLSLEHSDQLVGEIIESFELEEPVELEVDGQTFKRKEFPTDVMDFDGQDTALYVCGKIYDDTRQSRRVRESIEEGELNSYSISGEALVSRSKIENGEPVNDIVEMDLSAVTVCEEGMNQHASFATVKKDGYVQVGKKEDSEGNLVPNLVPKEEAEKIRNGNYEKEDDPCWEGYTQEGMKEGEDGEMVPNCVPKDKAKEARPNVDKSPSVVNIISEDGKSVAVTKGDDSGNSDEHPGDRVVAITKSSGKSMSDEETSEGSQELTLSELKGEFEGVVKDALSDEDFAQEDDILGKDDIENIVEDMIEEKMSESSSEDDDVEKEDDDDDSLTAEDVEGIVKEVLGEGSDEDEVEKEDDGSLTREDLRSIVEDVVKQEEEDEEEEEKAGEEDEEDEEEKQNSSEEEDEEDEKQVDEGELAEMLADMTGANEDEAADMIDSLKMAGNGDDEEDMEDDEKQNSSEDDEEEDEKQNGSEEEEEDDEKQNGSGEDEEEDEEKGDGGSQYTVSELQEKLPEDVFDAVRGYIGEEKGEYEDDEEMEEKSEDVLEGLNIDKAVEQAVEQQFGTADSPDAPGGSDVEKSYDEEGAEDEGNNPALSLWR